jgi:alkylhydroperoxidase domain protein
MTEKTLTPPSHSEPHVFTREMLDWLPWLEPVAEAALTARQKDSLIDAARAKSDYFRLLARDPDILEARTRTDKDIFYNPAAGAPRADRELAAAATSRLNGCIYCASVHARHAAIYGKREADVDRLLEQGVSADLGDERWNAVVAASVALTSHSDRLRRRACRAPAPAGYDELAILDIVNAASFFNWANRLMLSLGEPAVQG